MSKIYLTKATRPKISSQFSIITVLGLGKQQLSLIFTTSHSIMQKRIKLVWIESILSFVIGRRPEDCFVRLSFILLWLRKCNYDTRSQYIHGIKLVIHSLEVSIFFWKSFCTHDRKHEWNIRITGEPEQWFNCHTFPDMFNNLCPLVHPGILTCLRHNNRYIAIIENEKWDLRQDISNLWQQKKVLLTSDLIIEKELEN